MEITYPDYNVWQRENSKDPLAFLTGRNRKKVEASLPKLTDDGISVTIEPLREDFFTWFVPLYRTVVGSKQNANLHDVYAMTLGKEVLEFPYYSVTLTEHGRQLGGTIFSLRPARISYAYRAFQNTWDNADIPASPPLIGEYFVAKFASEHGIADISHGRDRNPYGINSSIGLAAFKLSVGCHPVLPKTYVTHTMHTKQVTDDMFVLEMPKEGTRITDAHLITLRANEEKYIQATKYPELLTVTIHYRD